MLAKYKLYSFKIKKALFLLYINSLWITQGTRCMRCTRLIPCVTVLTFVVRLIKDRTHLKNSSCGEYIDFVIFLWGILRKKGAFLYMLETPL